ncbi:MAG: hypothetical protein ACR2IE_05770 [Candidatus Sumerlaeaceae bacterium]
MTKSKYLVAMLAAFSVSAFAATSGKGLVEKEFTEDFFEEKSDLVSTGYNPYFILEPGYTLEFAGKEGEDGETVKITVLNETKMVDGVETRIVEEREMEGGKLTEVSRNYFAISKRTNNVYYFGEESTKYKDGKPVADPGSWEAGKDGAKYGLIMPGSALIGARYYQEISPEHAMDRAENISTSGTLKVPAGDFTNVLKVEETNPLEPGHIEHKYYAPGVGLIRDGEVVLVKHSSKKGE